MFLIAASVTGINSLCDLNQIRTEAVYRFNINEMQLTNNL